MRRTSCTMGGFCLLYLFMILLMRSGDVETKPGPDRIEIEKEFLKLSKLIEPSSYKEVGVNLDIPIAELGQIKEYSPNTNDALMTVFTRWRDKQPPGTDIRALLAEGLERSNLGSLSGELLTGNLVTKPTGATVTKPGSQTQPLSPDLIKRCADDFKFKYRTTLCMIRADPLNPDSIVPFNDMYTNLVLEEGYRDHTRPLEYRDLFDLKINGEFPKRIMIQGEAGAGKTTFCAKIAWDWITNSPILPKFVWVLVVPFREAKQYTIGEIAKSYLSKDNPATACQITEYIRSNPKDVFIAFDGLDEFGGKVVRQRKAGSKSEILQPQSADQTKARGSSSERGDIALGDIISSDEIATCPVLVTSRPWKVTEIRWNDSLRKLYTFISVEGFSKENVEVYIHKYFQDDEATADRLIQLTKDNDIISEIMAPYPFYIAMLCLMWSQRDDKKQEKFKSLQTFSQIFDEMFEFLEVHYTQKKNTDLVSPSFQAYRSQIKKLMEPVAKVAFIGLQDNTLIFKEGDFEQCSDSIETACGVGVLSREKILSPINDKSSPFLQSTIYFPHKLFQEYMAGVHLASLYESDHNEFKRLIDQVVLPRPEEFRHLLYFTVSRNKSIANYIMKCMVHGYGNTPNREEMDFLVDVSFESQNLDTAAWVRGGMTSLRLLPFMTAHTIAGYIFTGLYKDAINLWITGISHDLLEISGSVPSLKDFARGKAALHSDFYAILAKEGNKSKVQTVTLVDVKCPTSASSQSLVEALCSMPNLIDLTLNGKNFQEEFYSTLNAKASTLQVRTVTLVDVKCPTSASSQSLVEALCSMPNLTDLTLNGKNFQKEFYSKLNAKASTLQVQTVMLRDVGCPTSASSQSLAEALCSMPNLTDLSLNGKDFQEEFYSTLNTNASTLQVKTITLSDVQCPTSASSQSLAEALGSMPYLNDLSLNGKDFQEEFYSTLNANASTLQGSFPQISIEHFMFNGVSQADIDEFLQTLTDCRMDEACDLSDEEDNVCEEEGGVLDEENGVWVEERGVSDEENGVWVEENGVSDEENGVWVEEGGVSDEEDGVSDEEDGVSDEEEGVSDQEGGVSDEEEGVSDEEDGVSDEEEDVSVEEDDVSDEEDGVWDEEDGVSDQENGIWVEEGGVYYEEDGVSDEEDDVSVEEDDVSDEEDDVSDKRIASQTRRITSVKRRITSWTRTMASGTRRMASRTKRMVSRTKRTTTWYVSDEE